MEHLDPEQSDRTFYSACWVYQELPLGEAALVVLVGLPQFFLFDTCDDGVHLCHQDNLTQGQSCPAQERVFS